MGSKALSKDELIARLKAISADKSERIESIGAMCYSPAPPPIKHAQCEMCRNHITYCDWRNERASISKIVKQISELGYDAKVEVCCIECAKQFLEGLQSDNKSLPDDEANYYSLPHYGEINYLFSFKPKDGDKYHLCIANSEEQYKSLYSLLNNMPFYNDNYDAICYIADEKDVLKYMTGIDFDEQD